MKKLLLLLFILGFISVQAQQKRSLTPVPNMVADANYRIGCSLFNDPNNYTTGSSFSFNAPVNNNSYLIGPGGASYGCLYSVPNQAWFIITVNTSGNLYFNFSNTYGYDVDAAIWGPIVNNDMGNACSATQSYPLTCDYDTGRPDLFINNAQAGQKYVMLVTNYSNANTVINISQPSGGSVTYAMVNLPNCSMIPTASISGTSTTITEGQSATLNLNFTGSSPWNYTLSDGTIGTSYSSSTILTVYPTASQTYTVNSVSNLCGTNGGSGSVGISVIRSVELKTCLPLDGNATDSKALNDGTLQNGASATTNRNNESGKALQFDGIDDYVSLPANQLNNNTFTFAAWAKLDALPNSGNTESIALALGGGLDEHYLGVEYYNGAPTWKFSSNGANVYSTATVNTDWHLLVGVRSGGQIKLYVDGLLTGTGSVSGTASYGTPSLARVGSSISNNKFFKGKIDDIKIFNGSLIDPEVLLLQNYNSCNDVVQDTYISVQSISTSLICTNSAFTVRAFTNSLTPEPGMPFVVELSDAIGNFTNPTIIGSSEFLPLTAIIPNTVTGGSHKIRIRYGSTVSINTFDIYVNKVGTYNVTGTATVNEGQSANIALNFTGTGPWNYVLSTGLSGAATTSPWTVPVVLDQTTTYSVISAQNVCGTVSPDGNTSATVTVNFLKQNITCLPFNGNATDQKSNNTTTVNGALLTENRYGQINSAYVFDGASNYIDYTTNLLRKREYTMSAWVLANNISGGTQYILSQGETGTNTFQGLAMTNYGWEFQSYSNNGMSSTYSSTGFAANQWVHLTAVRTYTHLKLYVNGNLVSIVANNSIIPFKSSDIGRIGANSSGFGNYFNGKIDDVRLYKGALNDDEVYALYTNTGFCPTIENTPVIVSRSITPTTVCAGNTVSVSYTLSNVNVSSDSPLNVQLSDQNGSFANPVNIGSGLSSPITATIPLNTVNSNFYKIRLISSGGTPVTSINSSSLSVNGSRPTAVISGGGSIAIGGTANLIVTFTGNAPWTYAINNGQSTTSSVSPVTIPVSPYSTTTYVVTSLSNSCGTGTSSGSAMVTVAPNINLGSIGSTFCTGEAFYVSFEANYTPNPNFKVELSNANGSFASPTTIGTGTSSPILVTIPGNTPASTAYKIRIVSTSPAYISPESSALTVNVKATASISGTTTITDGNVANLVINFTGTAPWTYTINNGSSQTTSTNPLTVPVSPSVTTTYTITYLSNICGEGSKSGSAVVTVNYIPISKACFPFRGNANDVVGTNHGTLMSSPTLTTDRLGNANSAYYFNGQHQYISVPTNGLLNNNYTYACWFKATSASYGTMFSVGSGSISSEQRFGVFSRRLHCQTDVGYNDYISGVTINDDVWYHVAVTRGPTSYKVYLNGNLVFTKAIAFSATIPDNANIAIGTDIVSTLSGQYNISFNGSIDEVKIYRNELSDEQIKAMYAVADCQDVSVRFIKVNNIVSVCRTQPFNVSFISANFPTGQVFNVELSDSSGNFTSPMIIGTGTTNPISAVIPNSSTAASYKIRVVSTGGSPIISNVISSVIVNSSATATISGIATIDAGQSANLTINFTGSAPWTYKINNGTAQTTSTNPLTVAVSPTVTTTYTITSLNNSCGTGTATGSAIVTVNPTITLGTLGTSFCEGQNISVPFTFNFTPSSALRLELSDSVGNFISPLVLGTGMTSPIVALIPTTVSSGSGYRIRIVSDSPATISTLSGEITIKKKPTASISGTTTISNGQSTNLTVNFTGDAPWTYKLNNGSAQVTNANPLIISVSPTATNNTYTITSISNTCGTGTTSGSAVVTVENTAYLLSCYKFDGNADDAYGTYQGALFGGVSMTTDRFNNPNSAYEFDGIDDYIKIPMTSLNNAADYSFSMWVSIASIPSNSSTTTNIFAVTPASGPIFSNTHAIEMSSGGAGVVINYTYPCSPESQCNRAFSRALTPSTWFHLVLTRQSNTFRFYINGNLVTSSYSFTETYPISNNFVGLIGKGLNPSNSSNPNVYFNGKIDDLKIFKRALNFAQVKALYDQTNCDDITEAKVISLDDVSSTNYCRGTNLNVYFAAHYSVKKPLKVQLSDANGSFATPVEIGTGSNNPFSVQIPANQPAGTGYRIRLVSSDETPVISNESAVIEIKEPPTASISGTATINEGQTTNLTVNFTGKAPWTYTITGGTSQTTSTTPVTVSVAPIITTTYTVTSLSNICGNGTHRDSAFITVNPVAVRLLSCFPFSGNTNDTKGINNATNYGATLTTDRFENTNSAFNFSTVGYIKDDPSINLENTEFTVSLWFNSSSTQAINTNYTILNLAANTFVLKRKANGGYAIQFTGMSNFGADFYQFDLANYTAGQWHSMVFIHSIEKIYLYIDNNHIASVNPNTGYEAASYGYPRRIVIGSADANYNNFVGKIDDIQIYKGVLTSGQIQALYANTQGCFDATSYKCLSDVTYDTMLSGQQTLKASNQILGTNTIQTGANIYFDAKNSIILQPGFKTEGNAVFKATVGGGCIY